MARGGMLLANRALAAISRGLTAIARAGSNVVCARRQGGDYMPQAPKNEL